MCIYKLTLDFNILLRDFFIVHLEGDDIHFEILDWGCVWGSSGGVGGLVITNSGWSSGDGEGNIGGWVDNGLRCMWTLRNVGV